jgi:hypothetical protein
MIRPKPSPEPAWHPDEFVTERTLEKRTQISTRQWQRLRHSGGGPPHIVVGRRCIRYQWGQVISWMTARSRSDGPLT